MRGIKEKQKKGINRMARGWQRTYLPAMKKSATIEREEEKARLAMSFNDDSGKITQIPNKIITYSEKNIH